MPLWFRLLCVMSLALGGCGPRLGSDILAAHPRVAGDAPRLERVRASADVRPAWCDATPATGADVITLVGMASAATRERAAAAARRDMQDAADRMAGVRVQTTLESEDTLDGSRAHEEVRSFARETSVDVEQIDSYWEEVRTSGQTDAPTSVFFWVRGRTTRDAVERARHAGRRGRSAPAARLRVAPADDLGRAVERELIRRLSRSDREIRVEAGPADITVDIERTPKGLSARWRTAESATEVSVHAVDIFELEDALVRAIDAHLAEGDL